MLLSDLIPSKTRRPSDGLRADAICPTVNLRRSDVCNEAIVKRYCQILFLLKYGGLVIVRNPMQFLPLSISVGQMFVFEQCGYAIVRSCLFWNAAVQRLFEGRRNLSHCQFPSVRCLQWSNYGMLLSDLIPSKIRRLKDGLRADAICPTVNLRRPDVRNEAILERYRPILFLL